VRAEDAEPADLHLARLAGPPPAVPAGADGWGVVVQIAVGHEGEIGGGLDSVNVPEQISADF
jgi:hypothetical protein